MKNLKNIAVAAISLVIFSSITNAQAVPASYSTIAAEPLKVKYLGEDGEFLLFHVTLQSGKTEKTLFTVYDEGEGPLYSTAYKIDQKGFTVKVERKDADQILKFEMIHAGKTYSKSFSANPNFVEKTEVSDLSVTKL
jgi:hypothetical protein